MPRRVSITEFRGHGASTTSERVVYDWKHMQCVWIKCEL